MRPVIVILVLVLSLAPLSFGEKTTPDDQVYNQVRIKLANDPIVKGGAIEVEVSQGMVILKGRVERDKQKEKAERLAKKVKGVRGVENRIVVGPRP